MQPFHRWDDAWQACPRGDWLLAFGARFEVEPALLVRASLGAIEAGLRGTYLEPIFSNSLRANAPTTGTELAALDFTSATADSTDPHVGALGDALALLRDAQEKPEYAAAAASQALGVVVSASGDCATMAVVRYTHQVMADAVRAVMPAAPPILSHARARD